MKNQEDTEIDYLKLEQDFRQHLSDKYTAYMTSGTTTELMLLAALVDKRYAIKGSDQPIYSIYTIEEATPIIQRILKGNPCQLFKA